MIVIVMKSNTSHGDVGGYTVQHCLRMQYIPMRDSIRYLFKRAKKVTKMLPNVLQGHLRTTS